MLSRGRWAFAKMSRIASCIKPEVHRMGEGERFAKLAVNRVRKIIQGYFNSLLKISFEEGFPIFVGTVDFQRLHCFFPSSQNSFKTGGQTLHSVWSISRRLFPDGKKAAFN
jgi:hypothetical protein